MRLRYENTLDDAIAFQQYHYTHSPTARRSIAGLRWGGVALIMFMCFAAGKDKLLLHLVEMCILSGIYILILPVLVRRSIKRQSRRMYSEGSNKGMLGEHELEITEDGIIERSPYNETRTAWGAVERIESTPDHTFIYAGSMMAHVIPHSRINEGDYKAFLAQLGQRFQPDQPLKRTVLKV